MPESGIPVLHGIEHGAFGLTAKSDLHNMLETMLEMLKTL